MQEILTGRGLADRGATWYGPLLWMIAGLALYLLGGVASLFITALVVDPLLGAVGMPVEAGLIGLSVRNAIHPVAWGLLVAAIAAPVGRRLVVGIQFSLEGWLTLAVGLGLAAVTWLLIEEFVRDRYAYVDVDYVGFTVLTWPALVAVALSGWAALAVPRGAAMPLVALVVIAAVGLAVALLPSVAGASDGIRAENMPLAFVFLVDLAYAMAVVVVAIQRAVVASPA